jgi:hypothetical protein
MLQNVAGHLVYVVEFDTMPELPITGLGIDRVYAEILTDAIQNRVITKPGKYALELTEQKAELFKYEVHSVVE